MIKVTAAIIEREGKYLIARRSPGKHMAGKWEFPGGKIEAGETPEECLVRDLKEEFDIDVKVECHVANSVYDYGEKLICLMGYRVTYIGGCFLLRDHDQIVWVPISGMDDYDFAPADVPLIAVLRTQ